MFWIGLLLGVGLGIGMALAAGFAMMLKHPPYEGVIVGERGEREERWDPAVGNGLGSVPDHPRHRW